MSRKTILLFAALLLALVFACRKPGEKVNSGIAGTTDTSATATSGTDTSGTTTTSTAASATMTGSTGGTVSNLSDADKEFVTKAAQGGLAEVQLGQLAESKASSPDVKAFGKRMVDDHSKANDELKQLATTKGLALPAEPNDEQKKLATELQGKTGKDFDKDYMKNMVSDHEKDVKEFEKASKSVRDADLKNWASKALPTLQEHLRIAKETQRKVK